MIVMLASVLFAVLFTDILIISNMKFPDIFHMTELLPMNTFDVISCFAKGIYMDYVWAFELLSLMLTIIIAGIVMISGKKRFATKTKGASEWK